MKRLSLSSKIVSAPEGAGTPGVMVGGTAVAVGKLAPGVALGSGEIRVALGAGVWVEVTVGEAGWTVLVKVAVAIAGIAVTVEVGGMTVGVKVEDGMIGTAVEVAVGGTGVRVGVGEAGTGEAVIVAVGAGWLVDVGAVPPIMFPTNVTPAGCST